MNTQKTTFLTLIMAVAVVLMAATTAGAEPIYTYNIQKNPPLNGDIQIQRLDETKGTTIRVTRGGLQVHRSTDFAAGSLDQTTHFLVEAGDVVQIYQPAADAADPPLAAPTETFTVPPLTASFAAGSATVSGTAEDAANIRVRRSEVCVHERDSLEAARTPGAYSGTFPDPLVAGERVTVTDYQPDGDRLMIESNTSGETPCLYVDASAQRSDYGFWGFDPSEAKPYAIDTIYLRDSTISTVRLVMRRGDAVMVDQTTASAQLDPAAKPLPGDVIEIYRPADAAAPSMSWTLPPVNAVFDAGNDQVAVDAPASAQLNAIACRAVDCAGASQRVVLDTAAGRTIFRFDQPFAWFDPYDIFPNEQVSANWTSPDDRLLVDVDAVPGDLTPPVAAIKAAKSFRLQKILKRIKLKVTSNEAGTASLNLSLKPRLSSAARKRGKIKNKTFTLALRRVTLKAGTTTVSLKTTKSGRSLIKKLLKLGRAVKTQKANFTLTMTDASGNPTTAAAATKLLGRK